MKRIVLIIGGVIVTVLGAIGLVSKMKQRRFKQNGGLL
jgi:uncharacterized membrane protein YbaN (DUF454 family)